MKSKPQWYKFTFLDHVMNLDHALECIVCGYIVKETKNEVVISWWLCDDPEYKDTNKELLSIVKSTIIKRVKI